MIRLSELTNKQIVAVYRNCKKSSMTCDGCYAFGLDKCKTQVKDEMVKRFEEVVREGKNG